MNKKECKECEYFKIEVVRDWNGNSLKTVGIKGNVYKWINSLGNRKYRSRKRTSYKIE